MAAAKAPEQLDLQMVQRVDAGESTLDGACQRGLGLQARILPGDELERFGSTLPLGLQASEDAARMSSASSTWRAARRRSLLASTMLRFDSSMRENGGEIAGRDIAEHLRTLDEVATHLDAWLPDASGDAAGVPSPRVDIARARRTNQVASDAGDAGDSQESPCRESPCRAPSAAANPRRAAVLDVAKALGVRPHAQPERVPPRAGFLTWHSSRPAPESRGQRLWAQRDPDNAAPWFLEAFQANERRDTTAAEAALQRAAEQPRYLTRMGNVHGLLLTRPDFRALPPAMRAQVSSELWGITAAVPMSSLQTVAYRCRPELLAAPGTRSRGAHRRSSAARGSSSVSDSTATLQRWAKPKPSGG